MNIRILVGAIALLFSFSVLAQDTLQDASAANSPEVEVSEEERQYFEWAEELWNSLERQTGEVKLPQAGVTLQVPENYYFLNAQDAEKILVEVWGNPPGQAVLGMLFPAQGTPFDGATWGVTISYEEDGYVSDDDAQEIDYNELLGQMQETTRQESEYRIEQGYEAIELVGWAADPRYDAQTHKLYWAQELKFGVQEQNILNYNIRVLGRKGVLVLNFIADMSQVGDINDNLGSVMALAEFDDGARYGDFNPDIDKVAAYGIGALVAGKLVAKTGLIAVALIFLKKFGIFIVIGLGLLGKKLFSRKEKEV